MTNKQATVQRTIWLGRHGMRQDFMEKDWAQRSDRPHDTPLSAEGRQQAYETGLFLADKGIDVIYCSPFLRAVETAAGIAAVLNTPIRIEHGLAEIMKIEWFPVKPDYLSAESLKKQFPLIDDTYTPRVFPDYPENEHNGQMDARCAQTIAQLLSDKWQSAVWIGHGSSVGSVGVNLVGHTEEVCFKMCGLTGWTREGTNWRCLYSGVDHLSFSEDELKFHV